MEEAKTVLNSLALGWQSEIQRAFAPGGEDPKSLKTSDNKLHKLVHLLTVYTPKKTIQQKSSTKTRSPIMHLIYNFFSGFCKSPPKIKTKNQTLDTSNVNSFQILFQVQQKTLGPEKQKLESLAKYVPMRVYVAIRFDAIEECDDFHEKKLVRKVVA
jgi:hypothetical protein